MPPSRHSNHVVSHYPHPSSRDMHHGGPPPPMAPASAAGPHHPHASYNMGPPPGLPAHAINGSMSGPPPGSHNGPPPRMMMMDAPIGATIPPPHIPRTSSAQSHIMDTGAAVSSPAVQKLALANESAWVSVGSAAEAMEDYERALAAYETALRHHPYSVPALSAIAGVHRTLDNFEKAVAYFQRVLDIVPENGDTWGSMGHCYLMMDDLQRAYTAYQQALYHLPNPKEPKLWYGIGILYDRYGSLEHAEEAFASVVRMDPNYEKANEIYFRLGIIYKQQNKFPASLECFRYILTNPPRPLTEIDIWFQIGHVYEQQKEFNAAKEAYERVLAENPNHAKVLQQLGWLYHLSNAGFNNQERAVQFLTKSLESDPNDSQSWYLLGRAYMADQNYNKAYEAYQQAVYRDGKNPTFWCSIGVLYYQINQYRDALDAYSRAIRLNPYISEVWFDLGSLYEACNNQIGDAIHAYERAADLDPDNAQIQQRLMLLRNVEAKGTEPPEAPVPQDVHPTAYANNNGMAPGPPTQLGGGPSSYTPSSIGGPQLAGTSGPRGGEMIDRDLPGPGQLPQAASPPFRGGPHPGNDGRRSRGPPSGALAPASVPPGPSDGPHRGYPLSRGPSPAPRAGTDAYGRRLGSPSRRSPPPLRQDMHDVHGHDYRGHSSSYGGHPVDAYGRPMGGPMSERQSERERELDWERERERNARGYGGGRVTPKHEPSYARSQHGSNAPSPAFGRPPVYEREDAREYYSRHNGSGGHEHGLPGRYEERGPPLDSEREYAQQRNARYAGPVDEVAQRSSRPPMPPLGPTTDAERARPVDNTENRNPQSASMPANASAKSRRAPKGKEDLDATGVPVSPVPSAANKKAKSSRASSPWSGKTPGSTGKSSRVESKVSTASTSANKKNVTTPLKGHDETSRSASQSPQDAAAVQQRGASPVSSEGSNEPLAARGPPSRVVDEDYDDSAADALMGLAGAASASAPQPAPLERGETAEKRADSLLGKRPYENEGVDAAIDESSKRSKNVALASATTSTQDKAVPETATARAPNGDGKLQPPAVSDAENADLQAVDKAAETDTTAVAAETASEIVDAPDEVAATSSTKADIGTINDNTALAEIKEAAPVPAADVSEPVAEDTKEEEEGQINEDEGDVSMKAANDSASADVDAAVQPGDN